MSIYSNQPEVQLALSDDAPDITRPMIRRSVMEPGSGGAVYWARYSDDGQPVGDGEALHVFATGHWLRTHDAEGAGPMICRGCGASGHTVEDFDATRCSRPISAQEIATALLAVELRPEPARMPSHGVQFIRSAVAA